MRTLLAVSLGLLAPACSPSAPTRPAPVAAGLFPLPCADSGPLRPQSRGYCLLERHYVRAAPRKALILAAARLQNRFPGSAVRYMEASWPLGIRPMPPHLSHGDGRQIDLALFYVDLKGRPLPRPPTSSGYGAYEPPLENADRRCTGATKRSPKIDAPDPPRGRQWRLDEARTANLVRLLVADRRVRRVFIEPHLKARLRLSGLGKVRFAGCRAARHDDHIHVDFF